MKESRGECWRRDKVFSKGGGQGRSDRRLHSASDHTLEENTVPLRRNMLYPVYLECERQRCECLIQ